MIGLGTMLALGASMAADVGPAVAQLVPGPLERMQRKQIKADQARLAGGGGGMAAGKRQEMQAQVAGQARAQQAELMAQAARGSATGQLQAPQAAQVMLGASQQAQQQMRQGMSDIRAQDLALAEEQRGVLRKQQDDAMDRGWRRKQAVMKGISVSPGTKQRLNDLVPDHAEQSNLVDYLNAQSRKNR